MKKIITCALALCLIFSLAAPMALAADAPKSTAKVTLFYPNNGGPLRNQDLTLGGKVYRTDQNGQFTTEALPYGHYPITLKADGENGFPYAYTMFSQKVSINQISHLPSFEYLNNLYVYRKFGLNIVTVDSTNTPVLGMQIIVLKGDTEMMRSTVTTCIAGTISFDWMEMPPSVSSPESALNLGDKLTVRAVYNGAGKADWQTVEQEVILSKVHSENYVKLVTYHAYEDSTKALSNVPALYQTRTMPVLESNKPNTAKGNVGLLYDFGMRVVGIASDKDVPLDVAMFTLKDAAGVPIPVERATLTLSNVYLTYDMARTPATVSYSGSTASKYLVSSVNAAVRTADFTDQPVNKSFDTKTEDFYARYEQEVLRLVNETRQSAGVPQLTWDNDLAAMARIKAHDMAFNSYFAHESPVYGLWHQQNKMFNVFGYPVSGENLANVPLSKMVGGNADVLTPEAAAQAAFTGWKFSPKHYSNMISPVYTRTGVGFSASGGYFAQSFARAEADKVVPISVTPELTYQGKVKVNTTAIVGRPIAVTATPNVGFEFVEWLDETGKVVSKNSSYETTIPLDASGVTLTARFKKAAFVYDVKVKTIQFIAGVPTTIDEIGGTTTGEGAYDLGAKLSFSATPKAGFTFYGWYFGEPTLPTTAAPLPDVNQKKEGWNMTAGADTVLTALFVKKDAQATLKLVIDAKYGAVYGGATGANNDTLLGYIGATADGSALGAHGGALSEEGKTFALTKESGELIVNLKDYDRANYQFLHWMDIDTHEVLESVYDGKYNENSGYLNIAKDTTLVPVFGNPRGSVTVTPAAPNGQVLINGRSLGSKSYDKGSPVTLEAVAKKGYQFAEWSDMAAGDAGRTNPVRTIAALPALLPVSPKFIVTEKAAITITTDPADISAIGKVTGATQSVSYGTYQTLTAATKNSQYKFLGWFDDFDQLISQAATYPLYVEGDTSLTAKYERIAAPYALTITAGAGGTAAANQPKYFYGDTATLTAVPAEGQVFKGWYAAGRDLGTASTITTVVTDSMNIEARFTPAASFVVTFRDIDGRILDMQTVTAGGKATVPTVSRVGYDFIGWNVSSANLGNVTANFDAIAQYQRSATYTVTAKNGSVSAPAEGGYLFGNLVTATVPAAQADSTALVFSHWTRNDQIVSYDPSFSFMVDGNVALTAVYTLRENVATRAPLVSLAGAPILQDGKLSFSTQVSMPEGFTLVECGVVLSPTSGGDLTLETDGAIKAKSSMQSVTGQFIITKTDAATGKWYGRGYLIYRDAAGDLCTVYSATTERN